MSILEAFSAIGLPVMMAVGAILAWRMSKRENVSDDKPAWRDDSLDDWRKQRDVDAEAVREQRTSGALDSSGAASEEQAEQKRHQRIGG